MSAQNDVSYAFRLLPDDDLRISIQRFVTEKNIKAGWIASCVGSLNEYSIRFANEHEAMQGRGYFEILSLSGTVSNNGSHLHICISDNAGKVTGGHLMEGCKIYTTAEIVLIESGKYIFTREKDGSTPWNELHVQEK